MSSIFNLKTNVNELSSANEGTARMNYEQVPTSREISGGTASFSGGAISFKFEVSGQKWWIPNRSYIRLRVGITRGNGDAIKLTDNIAPNMGLCSSLFQSGEFRINDKVVSRISDFMPQIDALEARTTKSRSWLNGIGNTVNFWEDEFKVRQSEVCIDGASASETQSTTGRVALGFDDATNTVAVAADTGVLTFAQAGGVALPVLANIFKVGDEIEIDCAGVIGTVRYTISALLAGGVTLQLNNLKTIAFGAGAVEFRRIRKVLVETDARKVSGFELIWSPPLSLLKVGHAMPSGRYELVLNPQTSSAYQKACIESLLGAGDKNAGITINDYKVVINSMFFMANTVEGPRADNITYLLDLEQTRCQSQQIDNGGSFQGKYFDVSPSTHALTVAYQDGRAGTNSQISVSKFKSYNVAVNAEQETKLNRFYINFAGQNLPTPDADPEFDATKDYTTQRYVESQLYSGAYYDAGGCESIKEYHNRGSYYYFSWPRDGTDRSTRVAVQQSFNAGDTANMKVLLFDHSKQVARVRIQDGRVVDVQVEDA